jgi:hypothetical protein
LILIQRGMPECLKRLTGPKKFFWKGLYNGIFLLSVDSRERKDQIRPGIVLKDIVYIFPSSYMRRIDYLTLSEMDDLLNGHLEFLLLDEK